MDSRAGKSAIVRNLVINAAPDERVGVIDMHWDYKGDGCTQLVITVNGEDATRIKAERWLQIPRMEWWA